MSLNPVQQTAVEHQDGPLLILAGPGSGKTRVITHRIAHLIQQGVLPRQILALTFTNKAADEMRLRVDDLAPGADVWMGTFHRFASRTLRRYADAVGLEPNFTIYDMGDSIDALCQVMKSSSVDCTSTTPEEISRAISWAKNNLIGPEQYQPNRSSRGAIIKKIFPEYQAKLLASNAVDFDDLLFHLATLLRENNELRTSLDARHKYIMVDEYQDTNLAQYAIVRALSNDHPNLAVTGDPDQSIYGWRGANLQNILDFEKDYPEVAVVKLEQNYRSTKHILQAADTLIAHNLKRKQKSLITDNDLGLPVKLVRYPSYHDEANDIIERMATEIHSGRRRAGDFAIFFRVNALSRVFEQQLRTHNLPFQLVNGLEFYQRKEVKDVLAYLHLLNNPRDDVAFRRIINTPTRGIGATTVGKLIVAADIAGCSLLDAARNAGMIEGIAKRSAVKVAKFVSMIDKLGTVIDQPVEAILGHVLQETEYRQPLLDSEAEEDQQRLANIEELLTAGREFDAQNPGCTLEDFLEQSRLVADTDAWEDDDDRISLMTLHAAKGLEFPVVFVTAIEQGILPHERSRDTASQFEEERRLLFVGITRAKEELQLSMAGYRNFRGKLWPTVASPFLMELPREEMEIIEPRTATTARSDMHDVETFVDDFREQPEEFEESQLDPVADEFASSETPDSATSRPPTAVGHTSKNPLKLMTGAQLQQGDQTTAEPQPLERVSPEVFRQGMLVTHPEHGPGQIISLSGEGKKRTANVEFLGTGTQQKYVLAFSPLRPVGE